jgi:hypothetical protein
MTLIEVIQPDGRVQVYMTEQRNTTAIALEVEELYPDATVWRKSKDWRLTGNGRPADGIPPISSTLKTVLVVVALALILTPVITWATTLDRVQILGQSSIGTEQAVQAHESDASNATDVTEQDILTGEVSIVDVETMGSHTTMTLRVRVRNEDAVAHDNIQVSAIFLDPNGAVVPLEDGGSASISLESGEEGFVKLWAHSDSGVAEYELAIED